MAKVFRWKIAVPSLFVGLVLLALLSPGAVVEQRAQGQQPGKLTKIYFGTRACRMCHDDTQTVANKDALLYRGTEKTIWEKEDKHKDANSVLHSELGKHMEKILGWKNVTDDARCVNCHGIHITDGNKQFVHEETFGDPEDRKKSGVSCVVCHGEYREWFSAHIDPLGSWKKKTRAEKKAMGLNDLWDPEERAKLCCSCHVGNVAQGKVVTHQMYAAGHPPLPGFEMAGFAEVMPRHWELLSEKVERTKNRAFYERVHGFDADEDEQTRMLVISSVVAFRESVKLIADLADQKAASEYPWPELAVYDCYACHHDLKREGWRQKRGYAGVPGRPQLRPWSETLLFPAARFAGGSDKGTVAELRKFQAPFNSTPFGNPQDVAAKARDMKTWTDGLLAKLTKHKFQKKDSQTLLADLAGFPNKELLDFDSARQVSWAMLILLHQANKEPYAWTKELVVPAPLTEQVIAKYPDLKAALLDLNNQLKLDLPRGQVTISKDFLPDALQKIGNWNPDTFAKRIQELGQKAPKK